MAGGIAHGKENGSITDRMIIVSYSAHKNKQYDIIRNNINLGFELIM